MKIIMVANCQECPYLGFSVPFYSEEPEQAYCRKTQSTECELDEIEVSRTYPKWCPLGEIGGLINGSCKYDPNV